MIERGLPPRVTQIPNGPLVLAMSRSVLDCGCCVWEGVRLDTEETCTMAEPCCPEHLPLVRRFNDLMAWSVADGGTERDLLDVVDEILADAGAEVLV